MFDSIIIGAGPAGVSAGIYLTRSNYKVLILHKKELSSLFRAHLVDNYYGFGNSISGTDLIDEGINQAKRLGATVIEDEVINVSMDEFFTVTTASNSFTGKTILFATGKPKSSLKIKGFNNLIGNGISQCVLCDGFFFRNKKVAIVGSGAYLKHELEDLKNITSDITVFSKDDIDGYLTVKENIIEFSKPFLKVIIKTESNSYEFDGVFIALENPSAGNFASKLGIIMENNYIKVDENYMTNIPGIFAAGDLIGGLPQVFKAVYDGSSAGLKIVNYLKSLKK